MKQEERSLASKNSYADNAVRKLPLAAIIYTKGGFLMRRTLKWSAPLAALVAVGYAAPANAQAQEFQTNVDKARKTLTDLVTLVDKIETRNKEARAAAMSGAETTRTVSAAPGRSRTYTLILTGAQ